MILINRIKIKSSKKIILFFISILILSFYIANNLIIFLELLILLLCSTYIFVNAYTIKYSSVRVKILNSIIKKKLYNDNKLYLDRKNRFKKNNVGFMRKEVFTFINVVISIFRSCFF
jgi:hypothetical protein